MDDAAFVGVSKRVRNKCEPIYKARKIDAAVRDQGIQGLALDILHRDQGASVDLLDGVNGCDVGMIEARSGLRLVTKTADKIRIAGENGRERFEGDLAV